MSRPEARMSCFGRSQARVSYGNCSCLDVCRHVSIVFRFVFEVRIWVTLVSCSGAPNRGPCQALRLLPQRWLPPAVDPTPWNPNPKPWNPKPVNFAVRTCTEPSAPVSSGAGWAYSSGGVRVASNSTLLSRLPVPSLSSCDGDGKTHLPSPLHGRHG